MSTELPIRIIVTDLENHTEFYDEIISTSSAGICQSRRGISFWESGIEWTPTDPKTRLRRRNPRYSFRRLEGDPKPREIQMLVTLSLSYDVSSRESLELALIDRLTNAFDREPLIDSVNSIRVQDYNRLRKTKIGSKYEEFNQYMRSEGFEEIMNTFNSFQKDPMSLYMKVHTGYSKGPSKLSTQVSSVVVFYNTNKEVLKYIEFKNGETNYKL